VRRTSLRLPAAPRANSAPYVPSLSRTKDRGAGRRGLAQVLGDSGVGGMPRHADVDDPPRTEVDDEEGAEGPEAHVDDRQEVAGPDVMGVVMQEGSPLSGCAVPAGGRRA